MAIVEDDVNRVAEGSIESKLGLWWMSNPMSIEDVEIGDEDGDSDDNNENDGEVAVDDRESEDKDEEEVDMESISTRLSALSSGDDVAETEEEACSTGRAFGFLPRFFGSSWLIEEEDDEEEMAEG